MTTTLRLHAMTQHPRFQLLRLDEAKSILRGLVVNEIPEAHHETVLRWALFGEPHPSDMGSFIRNVLEHDFYTAIGRADDRNKNAIVGWRWLLHNDLPAYAHGNAARLDEWARRGGLCGGLT